MPRLILQLANQAPGDQLIWLAWSFSVLETFPKGDLYLDERMLVDGLAELAPELATSCGVRLNAVPAAEPKPEENFVVVSSASVVSQRLICAVPTLHVYTRAALDTLSPDWFWDVGWMARFRQRVLELGGRLLDAEAWAQVRARLGRLEESRKSVSLISSVFKADRFLAHFLKNCGGLAGYRDIEHWLIRPGSPGDEHGMLLDHARRWPGAIYLNLDRDPGLYETWNLGCCLAQGRLLSNVNVDDRRHPRQVERLLSTLHERPWADLASVALRVTGRANQEWDAWEDGNVFFGEGCGGEYGRAELICRRPDGARVPRNLPHCMPLWRRALHGLRGFFNEQQYGPSADWEFWLRCAAAGSRYYHIPEPLGLYLKREDSYWRRDPSARRFDDRVLARYGDGQGQDCILDNSPRSLPWQDLTRFHVAQNWCGVWLCLLRLVALPDARRANTGNVREIAAGFSRHYFGVPDVPQVRPELLQGGSTAVMSALLPRLLDDLHRFVGAAGRDEGAVGQMLRWQALLLDWHRLTGEMAPLIGLAFLQRCGVGDLDAERHLLRRLHGQDTQTFWQELQCVYRFAVPLEELAACVEDVHVSGAPGETT